MSSKNIFKEATTLFKRKKYGKVISLLEPKITLYRNSFRYFYLLGMSCLYRRDWSSAYSYLKKAYSINPDNINIATAYGLLLVRKGARKDGLEIILKIVENSDFRFKKGYKRASKILNIIRKSGSEKDLVVILETNRFRSYFPKPPINTAPLLTFLFALFFIAIVSTTFVYFKSVPKSNRENINAIVLLSDEKVSDFSKSDYKILLSDKEIQLSFLRAKKELNRYNDNLARREINRLLLSNASIDIKQKALALARIIKQPDLKSVKNSFSFEEVSSDPLIYERCYMKWQGRLSDLKVNDKQITFDFLVGYADRKIVEGIVFATMDFEAILNEEYAYEILGQVYNKKSENSPMHQDFMLKIISIRRINP